MADENMEDLKKPEKKEVIAPLEIEKKETSEGVEREERGKEKQVIESTAEETGRMEITVKKEGATDEEFGELAGGGKKVAEGIKKAEGTLEEDLRPLKNNGPEIKVVRKCPKCGDETQSGKFCTRCGNQLAETGRAGQDEKNKDLGKTGTKQEILEKVEGINKKLDNPSISKEESDGLKKLREHLLDQFDSGEDFGTEIGKKDDFKKADPGANKEAGDPAGNEIAKIQKELANKESLLSKTMERLKDSENHIEDLKKGLDELAKMKESAIREEAIGTYKASLELETKQLAELQDKVKKIIARLNKEE